MLPVAYNPPPAALPPLPPLPPNNMKLCEAPCPPFPPWAALPVMAALVRDRKLLLMARAPPAALPPAPLDPLPMPTPPAPPTPPSARLLVIAALSTCPLLELRSSPPPWAAPPLPPLEPKRNSRIPPDSLNMALAPWPPGPPRASLLATPVAETVKDAP